MKRRLRLIGIGLMGCALALVSLALGWSLKRQFWPETALAAAQAQTPSEARILDTLREMREAGGIEFGVPESDGRRLRLLAEAMGARNVVEIGTSTGYSALWLSLGVRQNEGRVTTFESDTRRAEIARRNFKKAGVDARTIVVVGDAHKTIATLTAPIDLVFIDADKEGYVDYLNKLLPLLRPGGLILAHNLQAAPEYLRAVSANPGLETVMLTQGSGLAATLKKK